MEKLVLDWNEYIDLAAKVSAEGCVLLKNDNNVLPITKGSRVSVFGRMANNYYKSGTGSGGMVNVSHVIDLIEAIKGCKDIVLNEKLLKIYLDWEENNPLDEGIGWGQEPWSQKEMELSDEIVADAAKESDIAIVVIGRTAGEDKDSSAEPGAYCLTDIECDMLKKVRSAFDRVVVLLNVGNIIDMSFVDQYKPDSVMYIWQGGMVGCLGVVDVLTGKLSPCGKLSDTIAYDIEDYPSTPYFGGEKYNAYVEDIYVGYRYFETFAKDRVRYPFGFGMSYTTFEIEPVKAELVGVVDKRCKISVSVKVTNTGNCSGKEVAQFYIKAPMGRIGKPERVLIGFDKTKELAPGESEILEIEADFYSFASFDDKTNTCLLEKGEYVVYAGSDVRSSEAVFSFSLDEDIIFYYSKDILNPVMPFDRFVRTESDKPEFEPVPVAMTDMDDRRLAGIPQDIPYEGDKGIKLSDVRNNRASMDAFMSQFTDEDLICIIRGEGMGSNKVTAGTAAAFGGVTRHLNEMGIPAVCCDDGPSGMRLDCGAKAFSLPIGTLIACSFNRDLITELFVCLGKEMAANKVECILGPGINIHRHPLNGRNFEYFSEDPYLTGAIASAELKGLAVSNVTGTIKHFCGNNQEKNRHYIDSVISARALREIYLKPFEIAIKKGRATTVMTTYGSLNGLWTAGSYDLCTSVLRNEWAFKGVVMTDWWAMVNNRGEEPSLGNFAAMARAQNDVYMVTPNSANNSHGDNTEEELKAGSLTRAELVRNAKNICSFVMNTNAMNRPEVEIINRPKDDNDFDAGDVEYSTLGDMKIELLSQVKSVKGTNYIFAYEVENPGVYNFTLTGKSSLSRLAQIPCTVYFSNIPMASITFNGTEGEMEAVQKEMYIPHRFSIIRLYVGGNGLELDSLKIERVMGKEMTLDEWIKLTRGE